MSAFILFSSVILAFSCSGSPPQIDQLEWRVVYRDDGDFRREEINIFLRISDPDDDEDPSEVVVSTKSNGFRWPIPRNEWIPMELDGVRWWGMPAIIPWTGDQMPNALYTVELRDLAGRTAELSFRPDPDRLKLDDVPWPEAEVIGGRLTYRANDENPGNGILILRNRDLIPISRKRAEDGLVLDPNAAWWEIWVNMGERGSGIRLGPFPLVALRAD